MLLFFPKGQYQDGAPQYMKIVYVSLKKYMKVYVNDHFCFVFYLRRFFLDVFIAIFKALTLVFAYISE